MQNVTIGLQLVCWCVQEMLQKAETDIAAYRLAIKHFVTDTICTSLQTGILSQKLLYRVAWPVTERILVLCMD